MTNTLIGKPTEPTVRYDGGTAEERKQIMELWDRFWPANDIFDNDVLIDTWDPDPFRVSFNSNGHTYYGLDDWLNIWNHYRPLFRNVLAGKTHDTRVTIREEMALLTDDYVSRTNEWVGEGETPSIVANPNIRTTMVVLKVDGIWKVAHLHFSSRASGPRPDEAASQ